MSKPILLTEELVFLSLKASSKEEALEIMANNLLKQGLVLETYTNAVIEREKSFATGLPGEAFAVAIPHTDIVHVVKDTISVAILETPVSFNLMGTNDYSLDVEMIFLLAIKNSENQVIMLQSLMDLFQDAEALVTLKSSKDKKELIEVFSRYVDLTNNTN